MVLINAFTLAGALATISIKLLSLIPKSSNGISFNILDFNKSPIGAKFLSNFKDTIWSYGTSNFSERITILSGLGYFLPFSISFKYDFDNPESLDNPNKDKFLSVRICFSFKPNISLI